MSDAAPPPCRRTVEWATLHAARELEGFTRARFAQHLRSCEACAAAVREIEAASAALDTVEPQRLSAATRERLSAAARGLRRVGLKERSPRLRRGRLAVLATTLAAMVVFLPVAWQRLHPKPVEPMAEATVGGSNGLDWDPAPGKLTRVAEEIRALKRPRRLAVGALSERDRTLRRIRERVVHLEGTRPHNGGGIP